MKWYYNVQMYKVDEDGADEKFGPTYQLSSMALASARIDMVKEVLACFGLRDRVKFVIEVEFYEDPYEEE